MSNPNLIEIGDLVTIWVMCSGDQAHGIDAEIISTPLGPGELWIVRLRPKEKEEESVLYLNPCNMFLWGIELKGKCNFLTKLEE